MNNGPVKPLLIAFAIVGAVLMFLASIDRSADTAQNISEKVSHPAAAQGNAAAQSKLAQGELEHCDLRDLLGRKLEWLPTADMTAGAAQDMDLCEIGSDLISRHRLLAEESANSLCEAIDNASSRDIARLRQIVRTPTSDPNELRQSRSIEMCFPENRVQLIKTGLRDFTPVIYSVGTVTINGTMCPAYLYVLESDSGPMRGTKGFLPAFRNACEGKDEELVSRGFQLPSNPSGPPLGDLLEQVAYTGAIPRTHSYKGRDYPFVTQR